MIGDGEDATSVLAGLFLLVLSIVALPAMLRLVTPMVGAAAAAGAGAGGGMAAAGMVLATGARMSSSSAGARVAGPPGAEASSRVCCRAAPPAPAAAVAGGPCYRAVAVPWRRGGGARAAAAGSGRRGRLQRGCRQPRCRRPRRVVRRRPVPAQHSAPQPVRGDATAQPRRFAGTPDLRQLAQAGSPHRDCPAWGCSGPATASARTGAGHAGATDGGPIPASSACCWCAWVWRRWCGATGPTATAGRC
jgi:hypothetical protein